MTVPFSISFPNAAKAIAFSFLLTVGLGYSLEAQEVLVVGQLRDTVLNDPCSKASLSLVSSDSTTIRHALSRNDGSFRFDRVSPGRYTLTVTLSSYFDLILPVDIHGPSPFNLDVLILQSRVGALAPVVVRATHLIARIKMDTIEYNTENTMLKPNASVEDLLRTLPGVQVDPDGAITLNGQKVQKLLVNGSDFFGASPTLVTQSFNAEMIGKVQFLDKSSRQAEVTGVDDGQKTKTINLVLKPAYSRSELFSGEAGTDAKQYENVNGILGAFNGAEQFAVVGLLSNTGNSGYHNAGGIEAGLSVGLSNNDPLGSSAGTGIPRTVAAGTHLSDKWKSDADHLNVNYEYGNINTAPISTSLSQQLLPDSIYTQMQKSNSINRHTQNVSNGEFDYSLDSLSSLHATAMIQTFNGSNYFNSTTASYFNDTLVNLSQRTVHSSVSNDQWQGSLIYKVRAKADPARAFYIFANLLRQANVTNGFLYDPISYYQSGSLVSSDTTDQRKYFNTTALSFSSGVGFTEPVAKHTILAITGGAGLTSNNAVQSTFNKGDGVYKDLVDSLSSDFNSQIVTPGGTLNLQYKRDGFSYTLGTDFTGYEYRQKDLFTDSIFRIKYFYFTPRLNARKSINQYTSLSLAYGEQVQLPTVTQLQPVVSNNNPLSIVIGNQDLHPALSHNLNAVYSSFRSLMVDIELNAGILNNAITTKTITDSIGRQISQAVNVNGSRHIGLLGSVHQRILPFGLDAGLNANINFTQANNFVDADLSRNKTYNGAAGISLGKNVLNKFLVQVNTNLAYTYSTASVNAGSPLHYWSQNHFALLSLNFIPQWELSTNFSYVWQQRTSALAGNSQVAIWNAYLSHSFMANRLTTRFQVYNILGQDAGITRSSTANTTEQSTTNIIGRYYMLTAIFKVLKHSGH